MAKFEPAAAVGVRVRCVECGASGYTGGKWQDKCHAGHPFTCADPSCNRVFATGNGAAAHHRNVHRADRFDLYARRAVGVRAYWKRRREARGLNTEGGES